MGYHQRCNLGARSPASIPSLPHTRHPITTRHDIVIILGIIVIVIVIIVIVIIVIVIILTIVKTRRMS